MAQKVCRREKLAQKVRRREIYSPVPPPSTRDFVRTFYSILLSPAQNGENGKGYRLKLEKKALSHLDEVYSKHSQTFDVDGFCWQNSIDIFFLVYKECWCF